MAMISGAVAVEREVDPADRGDTTHVRSLALPARTTESCNDRTLSRTEKVEMQQRLTARGFSTGGADGVIGPNTQEAIRAYQRSQGLAPDGYASSALLQRLRGG